MSHEDAYFYFLSIPTTVMMDASLLDGEVNIDDVEAQCLCVQKKKCKRMITF